MSSDFSAPWIRGSWRLEPSTFRCARVLPAVSRSSGTTQIRRRDAGASYVRRLDKFGLRRAIAAGQPSNFRSCRASLYNVRMPNRAYASIWIRDYREENMLAHFERFLATVPVASSPPGFTGLTIRAVDFSEAPVDEHDLRPVSPSPAEIISLTREHQSADVCYEVAARWDLWVRDRETTAWKKNPERLDLACYAPEYDGGVFAESGHFLADLGFEHLFTGHAGLLAAGNGHIAPPQHPEEARFLLWMSQPQNLREYQEKTRENIQKLMAWMRAVEEALPVQRLRLWSEGEENFEARLDEILAVR